MHRHKMGAIALACVLFSGADNEEPTFPSLSDAQEMKKPRVLSDNIRVGEWGKFSGNEYAPRLVIVSIIGDKSALVEWTRFTPGLVLTPSRGRRTAVTNGGKAEQTTRLIILEGVSTRGLADGSEIAAPEFVGVIAARKDESGSTRFVLAPLKDAPRRAHRAEGAPKSSLPVLERPLEPPADVPDK